MTKRIKKGGKNGETTTPHQKKDKKKEKKKKKKEKKKKDQKKTKDKTVSGACRCLCFRTPGSMLWTVTFVGVVWAGVGVWAQSLPPSLPTPSVLIQGNNPKA